MENLWEKTDIKHLLQWPQDVNLNCTKHKTQWRIRPLYIFLALYMAQHSTLNMWTLAKHNKMIIVNIVYISVNFREVPLNNNKRKQ